MHDISYHKVAEHRGKHRVWIENLSLANAGFVPSAQYIRVEDKDAGIIELKLLTSLNAAEYVTTKDIRTVTDKSGVPVIDISNKTISAMYGNSEFVTAVYHVARIVIEEHHVCRKSKERVERFWKNHSAGMLTEGTYCAGIGMATLAIHEGFAANGIQVETKWVVDRDSRFLDAGMKNNPSYRGAAIIRAKMEELEPHRLAPVDIFQFSMSCKVHSKASRSKQKRDVAEMHSDAAGIYGIFKTLESINPAIIISENVPEARDSASYIILRSVLVDLGYNIHELVLDNAKSGSFENRRRYWFVATDKNLPVTNEELMPTYEKRFSVFADVVKAAGHAPADYDWRTPSEVQVAKVERDKEKGNGFSNTPKLTCISTSSPTIRAEYAKSGSTDVRVAGEGDQYRMLTPIEHCLMKGADVSLIEGLSATSAHYMLGQGIDMGQGRGIAEMIAKSICHKAANTGDATQPLPESANDAFCLAQLDMFG